MSNKSNGVKQKRCDFRFADEEDVEDIFKTINGAYKHEITSVYNSGNTVQFRKDVVLYDMESILSDINGSEIKWVVLETPSPDEDVVACARMKLKKDNNKIKSCFIDVLCSISLENDENSKKQYYSDLRLKLETIGQSHGMNEIHIQIPQWRSDEMTWLGESGYKDYGGESWPEAKSDEQIWCHTMLLKYRKVLNAAPKTQSKVMASPALATTASSSSATKATTTTTTTTANVSSSSISSIITGGGVDLSDLTITEIGINENENTDASEITTAATTTSSSQEPMQSLLDSLFTALRKEYKE